MPQLVVLAAIGAGLYAGSRLLAFFASQLQDHPEVQAAREHANTGRVVTKDLGQLEYDPASGVYRPKH